MVRRRYLWPYWLDRDSKNINDKPLALRQTDIDLKPDETPPHPGQFFGLRVEIQLDIGKAAVLVVFVYPRAIDLESINVNVFPVLFGLFQRLSHRLFDLLQGRGGTVILARSFGSTLYFRLASSTLPLAKDRIESSKNFAGTMVMKIGEKSQRVR